MQRTLTPSLGSNILVSDTSTISSGNGRVHQIRLYMLDNSSKVNKLELNLGASDDSSRDEATRKEIVTALCDRDIKGVS